MSGLTNNKLVLLLATVGATGWAAVLITAAIEILTDEPDPVITVGKISLYVAFGSSILLGLSVFHLERKTLRN